MTVRSTTPPNTWRLVAALWLMTTLCLWLASLCVGSDGFSPPWRLAEALREDIVALRAWRVSLAFLSGCALAGAGAALQHALHNPLADPYVLGVSAGGALGKSLATAALALTSLETTTLIEGPAALVGALVAVAVLLAFGWRDRSVSHTVVLVGMTINAFAWAVVSMVRAIVPDGGRGLSIWLIGDLGTPTATDVAICGLGTVLGLFGLLRERRALLLMSLGTDEAFRLGVDVRRVRARTLLWSSLLVGATVISAGVIGFLGLLAPHLARLWLARTQRPQRWHLPASIAVGGMLLMLLDDAARMSFAVAHSELPTGALCALFGAPLFAWALWQEQHQQQQGAL